MPVYSYRCEAGHESERLTSWAARPLSVICDVCGERSSPAVTAPQASMGCRPPVKERASVREIGSTLEERFLFCETCGKDSYDVVESAEPLGACACGGERRKRVHAPRANVDAEQYPYFDVSLGLVLTSASHKRDVLKSRGLFEIGNELGAIERAHAAENARIAKEEAEFEAYQERLRSAPEYRDFRRMRSSGALNDIYTRQAR